MKITRIWKVQFGNNNDSTRVSAGTLDEALRLARKNFSELIKNESPFYEITKVELIAETD